MTAFLLPTKEIERSINLWLVTDSNARILSCLLKIWEGYPKKFALRLLSPSSQQCRALIEKYWYYLQLLWLNWEWPEPSRTMAHKNFLVTITGLVDIRLWDIQIGMVSGTIITADEFSIKGILRKRLAKLARDVNATLSSKNSNVMVILENCK